MKQTESANFCLNALAYMILCTKLTILESFVKKLAPILTPEYVSDDLLKGLFKIEKVMNTKGTNYMVLEEEETDNVDIDDDVLCQGTDKLDEVELKIQTSTFAKYWQKVNSERESVNKEEVNDDDHSGRVKNKNYNPVSFEKIIKHYLPACVLWTKLVCWHCVIFV